MGVQFPRRTLLVLLTLTLFLAAQASPAAARAPRFADSVQDAREGDPGDGVLSPSVSAYDMAESTADATVSANDMEYATTSAPAVNLSATPPGMFFFFSPVYGPVPIATTSQNWRAALQGVLTQWSSRTSGGWNHVR